MQNILHLKIDPLNLIYRGYMQSFLAVSSPKFRHFKPGVELPHEPIFLLRSCDVQAGNVCLHVAGTCQALVRHH